MKRKALVIIGVLIFAISLRLFTLNQIGRTWDESVYVEQGYKMIELMKKGDFDNPYFYTTYDHPPLLKYLYGLSSHFDVEKYLPDGEVVLTYDLTYSRLLSAIMFSLGVVITVIIGWSLVSPLVGIIAGIILAMFPFSLGLSQLVTTESFKIFIYPLAFYSYIFILKNYSFKNLIFAGIVTGIALQIKQSNALLIPLFGLMYFFYYKEMRLKEKITFVNQRFFSVFLVGVMSVVIFLAIWPQLVFHFNDVYIIHKSLWHVQFIPKPWMITNSVPEVFFGRLTLTPNFYYLIYFFITIPVVVLGFFLIGVRFILKRRNWILLSLILWFAVPFFIMSFYSWRQHGLRYIIEIYPAISLIAAIGFDSVTGKFTKNVLLKFVYSVPVIAYFLIILWQIKPYYLDYFNELVGGTNTVYKYRLFQQGWWGQGLREAGLYVKENAPKGSSIGLAISPNHVLPYFDFYKYETWSPKKQYDYVIVNYYNIIREGFNDKDIKENYKLVYEAKVDKATLVYVYKR